MNWPQSTIDKACLLVTDGTHYTPPDVGQGIPFLTVKDFSNDGHIDLAGCSHITEDEFEKAKRGNSAPKLGDVLFSKDGTVGKVYVVDTRETFAVLSSLAILRPDASRLDAGYFGWVLKTDSCLEQASRSKTGSAIRRIILKDLKRVRFPLPPVAEQKWIAVILDAADALRAKRREALAQLDTLLQSTFLDMFGDPVTNPMGWEERALGEMVQDGLRNGLSPSTKGTVDGEVLTLSAITHGRFDFAARKRARFDQQPSPSQQLRTDTFLICRGNGNRRLVGTGAYPDRSSKRVCFPDTMIGLAIDSRVVAAAYLRHVWRTRRVRQQIEGGARTTNGTHKVNQRLLSSIVFPVPPVTLQSRFAAVVESVEQQKTIQRAHLAELDTLFASLQSRAFRGEL